MLFLVPIFFFWKTVWDLLKVFMVSGSGILKLGWIDFLRLKLAKLTVFKMLCLYVSCWFLEKRCVPVSRVGNRSKWRSTWPKSAIDSAGGFLSLRLSVSRSWRLFLLLILKFREDSWMLGRSFDSFSKACRIHLD